MMLRSLCAAVALAGCLLLPVHDAAWAARGVGGGTAGAPMSGGMRVGPSSPTSGAIPRGATSGAIPRAPTSGALPSPILPITPNVGASSQLTPQPPMAAAPRSTMGAPYQPPCGAYPLPQC